MIGGHLTTAGRDAIILAMAELLLQVSFQQSGRTEQQGYLKEDLTAAKKRLMAALALQKAE